MAKIKHLTISHTSLQAWRRSPRKFYYEYVLGLRAKPRENSSNYAPKGGALEFGIAVHKFEELYKIGINVSEAIETAIISAPLPETGERSQAQLRTLLGQYVTQFEPLNGPAELELEFPLTDRITYVAHLDKLITLVDGTQQVVDFKTTSKNLWWDWRPTVSPNPQGLGYIIAAKNNGHKCDSIIFRGISTDHKLLDPAYSPKTRAGATKQRPPLFLEQTYTPQVWEYGQWLEATVKDANRMLADIESELYTCHCNIGDLCAYREICLTNEAERDIVIANTYDISDFRGFKLEKETE